MKIRFFAVWLVLFLAAVGPLRATAGTTSYLLRTPTAAQAQAVCQRYGLQFVGNLGHPDVFLVQASDALPADVLKQWVKNDRDVEHLEVDKHAGIVEKSKILSAPFIPSLSFTSLITDTKLTKLYGTSAWSGYVQQPAMYSTNAATTTQQNFIGTGIIVAIIDTGIDPSNTILAPSLVPGYDFTRNVAGNSSELADIDATTAAALQQRTVAVLDPYTAVPLNPYSAAFLQQRTVAVLDGNHLPALLGHGTMVAGLVHLVAPRAQIMPLKAFSADGSSTMSNIVRAIYYATDNGAKVINMSFEIPQISDELVRAINYATRKGVICVASTGNDGAHIMVYPAGMSGVIGVASVSQDNEASSFTNYGDDLVTVAAPGEALVTTYFGSSYAAVWGTSFSAALVSGAVADLANASDNNTRHQLLFNDLQRALSNGNASCSPDGSLGAGCMDLIQASHYIHDVRIPPRHHY
jgi:subtilisin family serine protease